LPVGGFCREQLISANGEFGSVGYFGASFSGLEIPFPTHWPAEDAIDFSSREQGVQALVRLRYMLTQQLYGLIGVAR
jgi:hypothetical protein